eukprot:scaffold538_cov413-Pavlova_lutheri.AAC.4
MASSNSHSDRIRSTWINDKNGAARPLNISETERLTGMKVGEIVAKGVTPAARHRLCGNYFPVAWIGHTLDLLIQKHAGTLRPLASRSLDETACVQARSNSKLAGLTDPQSQSYIQRLRAAAQKDPEHVAMMETPPAHLLLTDGLLFHKSEPNKLGTYNGPAVVLVPTKSALRQDLLHLVHDQSHFGALRTYAAAKRHFTWKGLRDHVRAFVAQCPTCQLHKPSNKELSNHCFQKPSFTRMRFTRWSWM